MSVVLVSKFISLSQKQIVDDCVCVRARVIKIPRMKTKLFLKKVQILLLNVKLLPEVHA